MLVCSVVCSGPFSSLTLLHSSILNFICSKRNFFKNRMKGKNKVLQTFFPIAKKKNKLKWCFIYLDWKEFHMQSILKKERERESAPLESIPFLYMAMQNILLLSAFSIPVMKAVCRNLKFYLLLWNSLFIIAYTLCWEQWRQIWSLFFWVFYYLDDQRSLATWLFIVFFSFVFVKFYWENHCLCFGREGLFLIG